MTDATAAHHVSHRALLRPATPGRGTVDAVVVPASRPAHHLMSAMELAAANGYEFVALCSGRTRLREAAGLAAEVPRLRWTLVDLPAGGGGLPVDLATSRVEEATRTRVGDLSRKRNLGLLLARLAGWRGVLFLDDDIQHLWPSRVREAVSTLPPGGATGMPARDYPDNSVACHALRLAGRGQDVFVSGSALAVDTGTVDSFFPEVYNEDWLFLFDRVRALRVSASGEVRQQRYAPFADPRRAVAEEFGDLLAEGLMSLLHTRVTTKRALDVGYWDAAIDRRRELLDSIVDRLAGSALPDAAAACTAVDGARKVLASLDGPVLASYVQRWRRDVRAWRAAVGALPTGLPLGAALDELGLSRTDAGSAQRSRRQNRSSPRPGVFGTGWRSPVGAKPSAR